MCSQASTAHRRFWPAAPTLAHRSLLSTLTHDPHLSTRATTMSDYTPLPKLQLSIIFLIQLAEPITNSVILPFINEEIVELGITDDPKKVGYYVGLIISLFFFVECLCVLHWGRLSDRIGRRPVVLFGLFGLVLFMICFGLSRTLVQLIISRALAGALNANTGIIKSMIRELTDETSFPRAASFMPLTWTIGEAIGPFLGGTLSRPYDRFPSLFRSELWKKYPYLLPCLSAACFPILSFVVGFLCLKETMPSIGKKPNLDSESDGASRPLQGALGESERSPLLSKAIETSSPPRPSSFRDIFTRPVLIVILNYAAICLVDIAVFVVQPLYLSTPIEFGGLGLPPPQIGYILGAAGVFSAIFQAFFFARLYEWFGGKRVYISSAACNLPVIIAWPIINALARKLGGSHSLVWAVLFVQQLCLYLTVPAFAAFPCVFLLVAALAVAKAGFAYAPLDPSAPSARLDDQVSQCSAPLLLVASGLTKDDIVLNFGRAMSFDIVPYIIRTCANGRKELLPPDLKCDNGALLAVLFTSGSTERPKGVLVEHASMINLVDGPTLEILPGDHVALTTNPSFDVASFEVWNSLVHGATSFILTPHLADIEAVVTFFREKEIHKAFLPTAVFHRLFSNDAAAISLGTTLRMINIGGEKLDISVTKNSLRHVPQTRLTHGYGSAETTVCATHFEITPETLEYDEKMGRPITIGRPIPNTLSFLPGDDLHPVELGQPGEICISGAALARGYLDPSGVSSAKFMRSHLATVDVLERPGTTTHIYRTGDIGKPLSSPSEIEAVLCNGADGAGEAAVVVTENDSMIAYVVRKVTSDEGGTPKGPKMVEWLGDTVQSIPVRYGDSVLEISCGSGMILFSIEPRVKEYTGLDMFDCALAFVQTQLERRGLSDKAEVLRGEANQLADLLAPSQSFNLTIINSVTQYFPSREYLESVLRLCIDRISDGGRVFLGDVRGFGLQRHHDLDLSTSNIRASLEHWRSRESELEINPSFFFQLRDRPGSRVPYVEILPKMMMARNELSQFRYQVVLHIGPQPPPLIRPTRCMEYSTFSEMELMLASGGHEVLAEEVMLQLLDGDRPPSTASELARASATSNWCARALSLSDIASLGIRHGWKVNISWKALGSDHTLAAVFARGPLEFKADFGSGSLDIEPTNIPVGKSLGTPRPDTDSEEESASKFRARCREKLHASEDALPLTSNGKVDRQPLAHRDSWAQQVALKARAAETCEPKNETQARIQRCVAEVLGMDVHKIPLGTGLVELGLHSFRTPKLLAALRSEFGLDVLPYTTIYTYPTVAALGAHLDEQRLCQPDASRRPMPGSQRREVPYDRDALDEILRVRGCALDDVEDVYETARTQRLGWRDPGAHELWTAHTTLENLLHALRVVISRQAILHTTFFEQGTRQVVLRHSPKLRPDTPRCTFCSPNNLFRMDVFQTNPPTLLCYFQQATIDIWSRGCLFSEIESVALGHTLPDPDPFRNFVDYEVAIDTEYKASVERLASRLRDLDAIPFSIQNPIPKFATRSVLGPNLEHEEQIPGLETLASASGIQASTLLKVAVALVMRHETKRDSVIFGQLHFCRNVPVEGITRMCGMALSVLLDCVDFRLGETVLELLRRTQHAQEESVDQSVMSLESVLRAVGRDLNLTDHSRFMWNLRSGKEPTREILSPGPLGFDSELAISWATIVDGGQVKVEVDYDRVFSERVKVYVDQFFFAARWLVANIKAKDVEAN
ncbi:hypothetical protein BOTBODRAFT_70027 [Botryobasidium botryosum FD-172 SS1]|uniref:Carrier domain-containing protein n=1 Tax=Botryobasidium botryosum (strain FD-172 SS1) TaxID=930990 RepID=A0A067LXV9_BOTB1|nr:hypothetical protein BOTBODRAFT_70027 [Botryobasidium botryosum FD-172 SS1]